MNNQSSIQQAFEYSLTKFEREKSKISKLKRKTIWAKNTLKLYKTYKSKYKLMHPHCNFSVSLTFSY